MLKSGIEIDGQMQYNKSGQNQPLRLHYGKSGKYRIKSPDGVEEETCSNFVLEKTKRGSALINI